MALRYHYDVNPRPEQLGGGWSLKLYEDGEEMGGGVFPPDTEQFPDDPQEALNVAFTDAMNEGDAWVESQGARAEKIAP